MLDTTQKVVSLTREELYEQIWTTPMSKLAGRYNLSDVGLAKICGRLQIPRPPVGYWQKLRNGKSVRKPKLPEMDEVEEKQIRLSLTALGEQRGPLSEVEQLVIAVRKPEHPIEVPEQLDAPHSLVEKTLRSLQSAKVDKNGLVRPKAKGCLAVEVAPKSIERAMRIMNALVKALEARGLKVTPGAVGAEFSSISVRDETVTFSLTENLDRKERPLTAKEQREREMYRWLQSKRPDYDYFPSGRLGLQIGPCANKSSARRKWNDGKARRVENCLNSFIAAVYLASEDIKTARREEEEWQRKWEEKERLRKEAEERQRQEEARIKDLDAKLVEWTKARDIRALVDAVRTRAELNGEEISPDSDLAQWLAWAEQRADRIDPVTSGKSCSMKVEPRYRYNWLSCDY
ncbi:MAG: hypothetical protein RIC55_26825 [Pirellulaceae bacterium]